MNWPAFFHEHREGIGLFGLAVAVTMPPRLPHWYEIPEWCWEWGRSAIMTFVSLRGPARSEASAETKTLATDARGNTVETKETVKASETPEEKA